jgi:RHS repeat-associated protein
MSWDEGKGASARLRWIVQWRQVLAAKEKTFSDGDVLPQAETRVWGLPLENPNGIDAHWPASSTLVWGSAHFYAGTGAGQLDQRYYSSVYGRFLTADLSGANENLADPTSLNMYAFVNGDPVNGSDPTGEGFFSWIAWPFIKIGEAIGGSFGPTPSTRPTNAPQAGLASSALMITAAAPPPPRSVNTGQLLSERISTFDRSNCAKAFKSLGIDLDSYKAGANARRIDVGSSPKMQERTVASVVGGTDDTTLGEVLGSSDASVIHGPRGAAILLGRNFFGAKLDELTAAEWAAYQKQRGSILLHELIHVYDKTLTDDRIFEKWSSRMFTGDVPQYGGSRWISIWINNDCHKVNPAHAGAYW